MRRTISVTKNLTLSWSAVDVYGWIRERHDMLANSTFPAES
jgi:hypothetical protein